VPRQSIFTTNCQEQERVTDSTFGNISAEFHILLKALEVTPEFADTFVVLNVHVLQNMITNKEGCGHNNFQKEGIHLQLYE
jgi:hypothetical protein